MSNNRSGKKIIVVLGMHRSGTSAITRGLEALGISLGDNLVPENWDNERGFWEDAEIVSFNEDLQAKLGFAWFGNIVVDKIDWSNALIQEAKEQAKVLLDKKFTNNSVYGFKDPRTAILIEFWLSVFHDLELSPYFVIALRHPLEVAQSLLKRNGLPIEKSLLLWATSAHQCITYTENEIRLLVSYNEILDSPIRQLNRISSVFNLPPVDSQSDEISQYSNNFLTKELRHNTVPDSELYDDLIVPPVIKDLYFLLKDFSAGDASINGKVFFDRWGLLASRFQDFTPVLRYLNIVEQEKSIETTELRLEKDTCLAEKDARIAEKDARIDEYEAELSRMYASHSWKVTKPLRMLSALLKKVWE